MLDWTVPWWVGLAAVIAVVKLFDLAEAWWRRRQTLRNFYRIMDAEADAQCAEILRGRQPRDLTRDGAALS
jgi:hypothetical protein